MRGRRRQSPEWQPSIIAALPRIVAAAVPFDEAPFNGQPGRTMRYFVVRADIGDRRVALLVHVMPGPNAQTPGSVYAVRGYALDGEGKQPPAGRSSDAGTADASGVSGGRDTLGFSGTGGLPTKLDDIRQAINSARAGAGFLFSVGAEADAGAGAARVASRLNGVADLEAELTRLFGDDLAALRANGRLNIAATAADLPRDANGQPAPPLTLGFHDLDTGQTWINAAMIRDADTLRGVVLHEQGVHAGMPAMLGEVLWQQLLAQVSARGWERHARELHAGRPRCSCEVTP